MILRDPFVSFTFIQYVFANTYQSSYLLTSSFIRVKILRGMPPKRVQEVQSNASRKHQEMPNPVREQMIDPCQPLKSNYCFKCFTLVEQLKHFYHIHGTRLVFDAGESSSRFQKNGAFTLPEVTYPNHGNWEIFWRSLVKPAGIISPNNESGGAQMVDTPHSTSVSKIF